ncbi:MAG: glutaredoxin domain-containing protein [Aerococcus suis]|nr:glutaredoxin domain-containing protein [Aerococcus suis]
MSLTIYSKPGCGHCKMVKRFLDDKGIDYEDVNVYEDEDSMNYLKEQEYYSLPQVFDNDDYVGDNVGKVMAYVKKLNNGVASDE